VDPNRQQIENLEHALDAVRNVRLR
jgi:hypothetical protein